MAEGPGGTNRSRAEHARGRAEHARGPHDARDPVSLAIHVASAVFVFLGFAVLLLIGGGVIAWVTYTLFRA